MAELAGWISVKDRLPKEKEKVLLWDNGVIIGHGAIGRNGIWYWAVFANPTHWMPLPDPPQPEQMSISDVVEDIIIP